MPKAKKRGANKPKRGEMWIIEWIKNDDGSNVIYVGEPKSKKPGKKARRGRGKG